MKTGLILVDIQNDYLADGRMELVGMQQAGLKAGELLSVFRRKSWPTFHIQHIAAQKGATFFLPETEGAALHESIKPQGDELVIQKHYPNSFQETSLLKELERHDVKKLVICGAMSHMCIDATTRAAFDLGFQCTVIQDACATRDLEHEGVKVEAASVHTAFMAALASVYAKVVAAENIL